MMMMMMIDEDNVNTCRHKARVRDHDTIQGESDVVV